MKKLVKMLEDIMVAITFAESGEYDEAIKHSSMSHRDTEQAAELHNIEKATLETAVK
jgi:hypothetical protein